MADLGKRIMEAGPFTAPLCVAMLLVIAYLVKQNAAKDKKLDAKTLQVEELLKESKTELKEAAVEYARNGEATRTVLTASTQMEQAWIAKADIVLAALQRSGG